MRVFRVRFPVTRYMLGAHQTCNPSGVGKLVGLTIFDSGTAGVNGSVLSNLFSHRFDTMTRQLVCVTVYFKQPNEVPYVHIVSHENT